MDRAEHLAWAKRRAFEFCDRGDDIGAFTSLVSDLNKHPDTQGHIAIGLGARMIFAGIEPTGGMREFIDGFN